MQIKATNREREPQHKRRARDFQVRQRHGREGQMCEMAWKKSQGGDTFLLLYTYIHRAILVLH